MSQDDKNQKIVDFYHDLALRKRAEEGPKPKGSCHYCEASVAEGLRWCDEHCRDDWEREQEREKRRLRNGAVE